MSEPLRLVIKAANQKYDDLKIDCNHTWSVLDLKRFLNQEYSFKPEVKGQRLIYSGHLLQDTQLVREVVSSHDESPYIFHLVYWNNNQQGYSNASNTNKSTTETPGPASSSSASSSSTGNSNDSSTAESDRDRINRDNERMRRTYDSPHIYSDRIRHDDRLDYYRAYNLMMSDFYRDMSQRYALAGLTGQSLHDEEAFFNSMIGRPAPNIVLTPGNGNRLGPQLRFVIRRRNSEEPEVQRGFIPNFQNIARNFERAFEGRDLVQDVFTFLKAILMSSMIMVYSSSNRLLIVMAIGTLLYLHQFRRGPLPQGQQQQQQPPQQQQQAQNAENNNNNNNNNNNGNNVNNNNNNNQDNINQQRLNDTVPVTATTATATTTSDISQQRQSRFRFIAEVVSSIFTSLIPEPPNVNQ